MSSLPACKIAYATMLKGAASISIELPSLPVAVVLKGCLTKCWTQHHCKMIMATAHRLKLP